jgi:hypothetical protein
MATITAENVLQLIDQMSLSEPLVVVAARLFQLIVGDALTRNPSNVDTISAASAPSERGFYATTKEMLSPRRVYCRCELCFAPFRKVQLGGSVYVLPKMCQPGQ